MCYDRTNDHSSIWTTCSNRKNNQWEMKSMRLSVGVKLVFSYAFIIILMVVIVGFSLHNLNEIEYEVN